ncbi:MAG: hypothetical protein DWQ36_09310 [Acidobacteria bacterium]|nr:MAG: hypothetical protein DWQ30_22555 [Acidobacteriota bacterium]REK08557.1 MAG: hypothetical protein DWQ36_09310 [Acidobacteriota bacterium]
MSRLAPRSPRHPPRRAASRRRPPGGPARLPRLAVAFAFSAAVLSAAGGVAAIRSATPVGASEEPAATFSRDVAPILFGKCVTCHRPGQVAPMSLLSYAEARPWAKSIARAVSAGEMPPWSGESDRLQFEGDLSLSDEQIETLVRWARAGAPEGDPSHLPQTPEFSDTWVLGEPDLVLELSPVEVPASGPDLFPKETIAVPLDGERWVQAIEFLPGDRRATHHFQATYASPGSSGQIGAADKPARNGVFGIWTAGMPPYVFPEGMGRILSPGTTITMDNHYHPFGEATVDRSRIGIHFGEGELRKEVATLPVTNTGLRIPPGAADHPEMAYYTFDRDMQLLAFSPHMHVRGKAMKYELIHPDGERETLLDVPDYDYNWQWLYYPTELVDVPAGSRIEVTARWDNSAANPSNPDPTAEVIYRGDTFSEMFNGFIEAVQKEGVVHTPLRPEEKLRSILSELPAEHGWVAGGFMPFGLYAPREGEGWLYLVQGVVMFTISLDDFGWSGDRLEITTQFPTPEASATTTTLVAQLDAERRLEGTLTIGSDTEKPIEFPFLAKPVEPKVGAGTTSAGSDG